MHFRPDVAVLLNITPDHLDRYDYKLENYAASKFKIMQNQGPADTFIFFNDDEIITRMMKNSYGQDFNGQLFPFTIGDSPENSGHIIDNKITININENHFEMQLEELGLVGTHNQYNSMAAAMATMAVGVKKETVRESLRLFQSLEHRMEKVCTVRGVEYINDSKATNVNSAWYALESLQTPVVWMVGGVDKGNDYRSMVGLVKEKVRAIICLGKDNEKLHKMFQKHVDFMFDFNDMNEAVKLAHRVAQKGDSVLLSPACASFDMFENYEDRGRKFKEAVISL